MVVKLMQTLEWENPTWQWNKAMIIYIWCMCSESSWWWQAKIIREKEHVLSSDMTRLVVLIPLKKYEFVSWDDSS